MMIRHPALPFFASLASRVAAVYNGIPPEGTPPLALGLYSTPEIQDPIQLEIEGEIPQWVTGSLYRGAQGAWDVGNYTSEHWFDGFSRNHRFEIADGKVTYRSRNGSDEVQDFVRDTGFYPGGSFAGDPCKAIFGAFETTFRDGVHPHGNKSTYDVGVSYIKDFPGLARNSTNFGPFVTLTVITDGNYLQQIDPVTLEPIELYTYGATNVELDSARAAAHPAIGENDEVYNYILDVEAQPPTYQVFAVEEGRGRILANITDAPAAYIHSMHSTEDYLILAVWQCDFGPPPRENAPFLDIIKPWDPNRPTFFYVIPKKEGGVIAKYTTPPFFAFHNINSFEQDGDIVLDIAIMPDHTWLNASRLENLRTNIGKPNQTASFDLYSEFRRFRLADFANGKTENGTLVEREATSELQMPFNVGNIELPRVNQAYKNKAYRYAYGVHVDKRGFFADSIVKIDTHTQTSKLWVPETNHLPSEPIFVPKPGCADEDDGVLLTVALDSATSRSNLVVIDAKGMNELGRAKLPIVMGYGFHGIWGQA